MAHHGWVAVDPGMLQKAYRSPFGRLFPARSHQYNSHAISLLAGALGPLQAGGFPSKQAGTGLAAGFTFLGQFIDHDLTEFRVVTPELAFLEQNPIIGQRQQVLQDGGLTSTNGRTGSLDLDSVYGLLGGPDGALFDEKGYFKLREHNGVPVDIERLTDYRDGRRIADPRNDENKIIVQLHVLFERLHNKLHVPPTTDTLEDRVASIKATRAKVVRVFRQIVVKDYLPRVANPDIIQDVWSKLQEGKTFYQKMNRDVRNALVPRLELAGGKDVTGFDLRDVTAMPVEFAHAVFRLGHSQLRDSYKLTGSKGLRLFNTMTSGNAPQDPRDLRGNAKIDDDIVIDWKFFFGLRDHDGGEAQSGEPLDANLPASIFRLPPPSIGEPPISLAERNIRRGVDFGLPSGQEVAYALRSTYGAGIAVLSPDQVLPIGTVAEYPEIRDIDAGFAVDTPLWLYILREASEQAPTASHLGHVGSYIVAETILGSLYNSPDFDLAPLMTNYGVPADSSAPSAPAKWEDIFHMTQMLGFLAISGF
ncbi:peroxidase family protein [Zavarzinia aquatilis]|nr:peroxidase family protein [Zavarzinia aquatilis]